MNLKELWEQQSPHVKRFKNIFAFMDFCHRCRITPDNSLTYYDKKEGYMYLNYSNVTSL